MTKFGTELRRGTLDLVLLRLLEDEERYGYELVTELERRSEGRLEVREGTLYPVLYRLEDQGLITPTWHHRERGVPRKYYKLSSKGAGRLQELAEEWRSFSRLINELLARGKAETPSDESKEKEIQR